MAFGRFDPERELEHAFGRFNRWFGDVSPPPRIGGEKEVMTLADWAPAVDVRETATAYLVDAELPDVKKEDVHVTVADGVLTLTGERRREANERTAKLHRVERSYGRFERSFTLPSSVDAAKISATFRDGMLLLTVPKVAAPAPSAHEIKIA